MAWSIEKGSSGVSARIDLDLLKSANIPDTAIAELVSLQSLAHGGWTHRQNIDSERREANKRFYAILKSSV